MIHLKYKCKVNFVKLHLICIYRCLKLVFGNASAGHNTGCRSVVNRARLSPPKCLDNGNGRVCSWLEIASGQLIEAVHTRACTGIKKRP